MSHTTQSRTFTLLVTVADEAMAAPVTETGLNYIEDVVHRGLGEGVRGFCSVSSAMVHAFDGDHVAAAGPRMKRAKMAHCELREGR